MPAETLSQIQHQTLILWGEHDRLFDIRHGEQAAAIMPNAILKRIPQAGHLSMMDQPEIFHEALRSFLESTPN
ncbi:alpha/beta hydrolase (plasmid) [Photobacterium sp. GJ3]|uniref:alpha/beta fold hydrolase n=1 Tax=Photobacterium sp. GJ3 TaxID=2829502 RepID=UPI001B8C68F7|nr:alpha/beta hydrolase [Photobacterium sp. GJ3]